MRRWPAAVCAALLVTSCASTATAGSAATAASTTSENPPAWHAGTKAEAVAEARRLLAEFRIPAGAERVSRSSLPARLRSSADPGAGWAVATEYLVVARDQGVLTAFLDSPPLGLGIVSGSDLVGSGAGKFVYAPAPGVDAGLVSAGIQAYPGGKALITASVSLAWLPYRTAAEYVDPSRIRSVTAGIQFSTMIPGPARTRTFTSPVTIAKLADLLNASAPVPRIILIGRHCAPVGPSYTLTFTPDPARGPGVTVSIGPCGGAYVTVGGKAQPPLWDLNDRLENLVRALLGNPQPAPLSTRSLASAP